MATKTFKLGEVCQGGVITAVTTKKSVTIIAKEWDTSSGYSKSSSQVNAKEFNRLEVEIEDDNAYRRLYNFLNDLTSSYHSEKILEWCLSHSELKLERFWR
jgi:hypothetical protein